MEHAAMTAAAPELAPPAGLTRGDFPDLQRDASRTSAKGQKAYLWLARVEIAGLVAASAFGSLSFFSDRSHVPFALATVMALLVALVANFLERQGESDRAWFDGRAIAESVKTSSWRYMMRIKPYDDDGTCNRIFARQLVAILNAQPEMRHDLATDPHERHQITPRMREIRALPLDQRLDWYRRNRILDQVEWYRSKASENSVAARHWYWASIVSQVAALVAAVLTVVDEPRIDAVGVLATVSASVTAWSSLRRHDDLSRTYAVASQELLAISDLAEEVTTEPELSEFVQLAEAAISREHTMWIAKRGEPRLTEARESAT